MCIPIILSSFLGGEESDPNSPTGSRTVNRVTKYDCEHKQWSTGPSMLLARRWAGAIVVGDSVYVIGNSYGKDLEISNNLPETKLLYHSMNIVNII